MPHSDNPKIEEQPEKQTINNGQWLNLLLYLILLFAIAAYYSSGQNDSQEVPYSNFKQNLREGMVASILIRGDRIRGEYTRQVGDFTEFTSVIPPIEDAELFPLLEEHDVEVSVSSEEQAPWMLVLINLFPWLLLIALFLLSRKIFSSRGDGLPGTGIFSFTKSKARLTSNEDIKESYDDIAGLKHAKKDLTEIIDFLQHPEKYQKIGAKIPKGILLVGPPGTGKTLLAKATAAEAGVPFFSITGSEFVEMFVGVGASRVRDMYKEARAVAPALIFIDEIDSVGRSRSSISGLGNDEREQTLNQILAEMDGFKEDEAIVVIAATNRPDILDSALTRPGRFDRKVVLDLPQRDARVDILRVHIRKVSMADDIDLDSIAASTIGFSGADLANLVNEAALLAARDGVEQVENIHLQRARDKIVLGEQRDHHLSEKDKERTAYHEAGHAVTAFYMPHADDLRQVSIIPRGLSLGQTEQIPEEDRITFEQHYLEDRISVLLGGRCAERLIFDEVSSGAANDLSQATFLARHMVTEWGMSEGLGPMSVHSQSAELPGQETLVGKNYSEHTAEIIDEEVKNLIRCNEDRTMQLLSEHKDILEKVANALLQKEVLTEKDLAQLLGNKMS